MQCFLCIARKLDSKFKEKDEEIIEFPEDIYSACNTFLKARKHHNHKYDNVILPEQWGD